MEATITNKYLFNKSFEDTTFAEKYRENASIEQIISGKKIELPNQQNNLPLDASLSIMHSYVTKFDSSTPLIESRFELALFKNIKYLKSFRELQIGWDGFEAPQIPDSLIDKALTIIKKLTYQPSIFPTARESIQFEYEKGNDDYLEFEISLDKITMLLEINNNYYPKTINNIDEIPEAVREFFSE